VRKVLGASTRMLVFKFSTEYSLIILVAFFIAAPLAYYLMDMWLQTFEYHVGISMLNFVLPLIITLVISSLTVGFQVIAAATANPVESLRID
jgi:ABC-type antimicrobial peptide transport system permease subunit